MKLKDFLKYYGKPKKAEEDIFGEARTALRDAGKQINAVFSAVGSKKCTGFGGDWYKNTDNTNDGVIDWNKGWNEQPDWTKPWPNVFPDPPQPGVFDPDAVKKIFDHINDIDNSVDDASKAAVVVATIEHIESLIDTFERLREVFNNVSQHMKPDDVVYLEAALDAAEQEIREMFENIASLLPDTVTQVMKDKLDALKERFGIDDEDAQAAAS